MPPFKESDLSQTGVLKFLRINSSLYVGPDSETHRALAINDGLMDDYKEAMSKDRSSFDAGCIQVSGQEIKISGKATTIGMFERPEIREKTLEAFKQQAPNHTVTGRQEF